MPSIFLSQDTVEYLKRASNGQSMDATVRRLLSLGRTTGGQLVRRQVSRQNLSTSGAYTYTILERLVRPNDNNPQPLRRELQAQVHDHLRAGGLFELYPDDDAPTKNGQPRWKQRFTNALAHLKRYGCLEDVEKANPQQRWRGVKYQVTEKGEDFVWQYGLHLEAGLGGHCYLFDADELPGIDDVGTPLCPKPLETWEIPVELVGRKSRPTKRKEFASSIREPSALGEFGAGLPIDEQHAALDLVFTHEEAEEEEGPNPED